MYVYMCVCVRMQTMAASMAASHTLTILVRSGKQVFCVPLSTKSRRLAADGKDSATQAGRNRGAESRLWGYVSRTPNATQSGTEGSSMP